MRNSSLVKRSCAENVTGLKHITEDMGVYIYVCAVEERSLGTEVRSRDLVERKEVRMLE